MTFHRRNSLTETNHIGSRPTNADDQHPHPNADSEDQQLQHHSRRQTRAQRRNRRRQQKKAVTFVDGGNSNIVQGEFHPEIVQLWKLKNIAVPTQYDCLYSSGRAIDGTITLSRHDHKGNLLFTSVVDAMASKLVERQQQRHTSLSSDPQEQQLNVDDNELNLVAREIVKHWRKDQASGLHPGRFLVFSTKTQLWYDVGNARALQRTEVSLRKSYQRQLLDAQRRQQQQQRFQLYEQQLQQYPQQQHLQTLPEDEPIFVNQQHRLKDYNDDKDNDDEFSGNDSSLFRSSSSSLSLSSSSFWTERDRSSSISLESSNSIFRSSSASLTSMSSLDTGIDEVRSLRTFSHDSTSTTASMLSSLDSSCHSVSSWQEDDLEDPSPSVLATLVSPNVLEHNDDPDTDRLLCGCSSVVTLELPNNDETVLTLDLVAKEHQLQPTPVHPCSKFWPMTDKTEPEQRDPKKGSPGGNVQGISQRPYFADFKDCSAVTTLRVADEHQKAVDLHDFHGSASTVHVSLPQSFLDTNHKKRNKKRLDRGRKRFYGVSSLASSPSSPVLLEYSYCGRCPSLSCNLLAEFYWVLDAETSLPRMYGKVWISPPCPSGAAQ